MLSMYLSSLYNKKRNEKKGLPQVKANAKWTQIILPVVLGIFALFYNSVFAIYILMGQLVSAILLVPQLMLVDYMLDKKDKKNKNNGNGNNNIKKNNGKENIATLDYSRKF
jgi:membrane protein insertase Oxa1/YidC/SpoIIIJ